MRSAIRSMQARAGDCLSPRWKSPPNRSRVAVICSLAVGASLLLVVPYFLPVHRSLSDSYSFGFNNKGAVALWVIFSLGFGYWHGPFTARPVARTDDVVTRRPLWAMLALASALHLAAWVAGLWYGPLQEAKYLIDRLQHLAGGERVFRDFEMAYGAGLLYLPLWLSRTLHLSLLSGYSLLLLIEQDVGILMLWYVVQSVGRGMPRRNVIFVVLCLTCLAWIPLVPAQYSTLRYWLVPATVVFAYRLAMESQKRVPALLVLMAGFVLALLVSQEQTIPMVGGVVLFAAVFLRKEWRWIVPGLIVFVAWAGAILWVAYRANWLETLINIGSGAYAVPIGPAPILLPMLALLLVAACVFVEAIRCRSSGSVQTVLLCLSPFSLTAAFGRFDSVHLIANTFCAGVVGWFALSWNERWWRRVLLTYLVIVFVLPTQLPIVYRDDLRVLRHTPRRDPGNTLMKAGLPTFFSPMGEIGPDRPGERLPFNYTTGRFYGTTDLITPKQAEELVAEMRSKGNQTILMEPLGCVWSGSRKAMMLYNTGLFYPRARQINSDLHAICDEVEANYEEVRSPGLSLPRNVRLIRRRQSAQ